METTQNSQTPWDEAKVNAFLDRIFSGATISASCGMEQEQLEAGYALGYNLYTAGNYAEAETLFQALSLYDHTDERFWTGLAGCRQAQGRFKEAIEAYTMAGLADALKNPIPFVHAGICYVKLGDIENAKGAFIGAVTLGDPNNSEHEASRRKAQAMLEILQKEPA